MPGMGSASSGSGKASPPCCAAKAENPRLQRAAADGLATCMELRGNALSRDARFAILAELIEVTKSDATGALCSRTAGSGPQCRRVTAASPH